MPRGGSRKGAGAPRGNLNALKTGQHSRRIARLFDEIPDNSIVLMTPKGGARVVQRKDYEKYRREE